MNISFTRFVTEFSKCHKRSQNFRQASFVTERHHITVNPLSDSSMIFRYHCYHAITTLLFDFTYKSKCDITASHDLFQFEFNIKSYGHIYIYIYIYW